MKKTMIYSGLIAFGVSILTLGAFQYFNGNKGKTIQIQHLDSTPSKSALYRLDENGNPVAFDFTETSEKVVKSVVYIQSTQASSTQNRSQNRNAPDPFRDFFFFFDDPDNGGRNMPRVGSGSGVIINENGYIVTNNHVIADADDIEVTLNDNRTYKATLIGTDPTTDIALIQIKEKNLPALPFVNSDQVKVGEWVLAVGNPFSLTSTVTAGIVSAKARNININQEQYAVESFIQTDAAINPGNSGGALVNIDGGLIGINTAIASQTGTYNGYGFAVPSNLVNKVVEDLLKFGIVQRGVLGVSIITVNGNLAKQKELDINNGAYVDSLLENSAAGIAGIKAGDVIVAVDDVPVSSSPSLQEQIARHRPGDKVKITVNRKGEQKSFQVTLNNRSGNVALVEKPKLDDTMMQLGAEFKTLDDKTADKLDIDGGVKVVKIGPGKLRKNTQMQEGFIITKVDGRNVTSVEDLQKALDGKKGGVMLEGVYEDLPGEYYYAFGL